MADDVRVKLSAEGVSEIVDALKRIREEAKQTGEETAGVFEQLGERFDRVTEYFMSYLALEKILDGMKDLFKDLYDGAIQLGNLSKETGFAVGSLQALDKMAEEASVSQESMNKALTIFTRNVGMAGQGAKQGGAGFSALGISMKELQGMTPEQQLQLVAEKLHNMKSATDEAAAGTQIFGRSFAEIEPVIDEVAEGGLPKMEQHLRDIGLLMNDQVVNQMKAAHVAMTDISDEVQGMGQQFLLGLLPAVTQSMDGIVESTQGEGVNAFKTLGEWAGKVVKTIVAGFEIAGATIAYVIAQIENGVNHAKDGLKDLGAGLVNAAKNSLPGGGFLPDVHANTSKEYQASKDAISDAYGAQLKKVIDDFNAPPPSVEQTAAGRTGKGSVGYGAGASQLASARLQLIRAQLQAELAEYQAHAKLMEAQEKEQYEAGKLSLQQYYKDRADVINGQYDLEIASLKKQRAAIAALPIDPNDGGASAIRNRAQLAQLDGELATKQIERQTTLASLAQQERQEQQRNYEQKLAAEQKLLTIEGEKAAAAKLGLDIETQKLTLELQKSGASKSEIDKAVGAYKAQGLNQINFNDAKKDATDAMSDLNAQIAAIKERVKDGSLFPVQAEQQIIDLERQRLPALQALAQQMVDLANKTKTPGNPLGDQGMIAQAEQYAQKVDAIRLSTDQVAQEMGKLKQVAQDSLVNGFSQAINGLIGGTETAAAAFRKMAFDIASSMVQLETKFLANQFLQWLSGSGQGGGAAGGIASASNSTQSFFGRIGGMFSSMFGGGASSAASAASETANTTAVTANTASQTALTTANSALIAAVTANTAAVTAAAASSDGSSAGSWLSSIGSAFSSSGHALGGHIRGPGTSTSDSIPAMLSDGEFVVNADATSKFLPLLHAINGTPGYARGSSPGVRRYAEGGVVAGAGVTENHYHVDASEVPHHVIQKAVDTAVLNVIAKHPQKVRNTIG